MAEEFRSEGIAVNALWPRAMIETAASDIIGVASEGCRTADIMADAAHAILTRTSDQCTGRFLLDDDVLAEEGCRDFEKYAATLPSLPRWRLERQGLPLLKRGNGQSLRVGFLEGARLQIAPVADASSKPLHRFFSNGSPACRL